MATRGIRHGRLGEGTVHLCVDMQRLFGPGYPWAVPWFERVVPKIDAICRRHPARTIFTRFVPVQHPGEGRGTWARYYERWAEVTLDRLGPDPVRLVEVLEAHVPPARVVDKHTYSPWTEQGLARCLVGAEVDTMVITGGETDVCVLATTLGAIDRGYRTILVTDALCSSFDDTHDALMELYLKRFSEQLEVVTTEELLDHWA